MHVQGSTIHYEQITRSVTVTELSSGSCVITEKKKKKSLTSQATMKAGAPPNFAKHQEQKLFMLFVWRKRKLPPHCEMFSSNKYIKESSQFMAIHGKIKTAKEKSGCWVTRATDPETLQRKALEKGHTPPMVP